MFHTVKGKGKKFNMFFKGLLYAKLGCVDIFIAHAWFRASNLQPNKAFFPWLPQPEKEAQPGCTAIVCKGSGAKTTETAHKRSQDELRVFIVC
jgi:hypothetical protein